MLLSKKFRFCRRRSAISFLARNVSMELPLCPGSVFAFQSQCEIHSACLPNVGASPLRVGTVGWDWAYSLPFVIFNQAALRGFLCYERLRSSAHGRSRTDGSGVSHAPTPAHSV